MPSLEALLEAERRGILPEDKKPLLAEARKRGLVQGGEQEDGGRDFTPDQEAAYKEEAGLIEKGVGSDGFTRRMFQSATLGGGDELIAGAATLAKAPFDAVSGGPGIRDRFNREWARQQAHLDASNKATEGVGLAADVAGGFMMGAPRAAGALLSGANLSRPTAGQALRSGAKVGAVVGGAQAFNDAEGGVVERLGEVPEGVVGGAAAGAILGPLFHAGSRFAERRRAARTARAEEANRVAQEFEDAGVSVPGGYVLTDSPAVQGAAQTLSGMLTGGALRRGAAQSINEAEQAVRAEFARAGGVRSPNEAGRETQDFLRRQLTERSIPLDPTIENPVAIRTMRPEQLQDVSGVPPAPSYIPQPPRVEPVPPSAARQFTEQDIIDEVRNEIPDVRPQDIREVMPRLPYVDRAKVSAEPAEIERLTALQRDLEATRKAQSQVLDNEIFQTRQVMEQEPFFSSPGFQKWKKTPIFDDMTQAPGDFDFAAAMNDRRRVIRGAPDTPQEQVLRAQFYREVGGPAEGKRLLRIYADRMVAEKMKAAAILRERDLGLRVSEQELKVEQSRQAAYDKALQDDAALAAREVMAERRRRAAELTERRRLEAETRARPTAAQVAQQRSREAQQEAQRLADEETRRAQNAANIRFEAEQEARRQRATQPIRIGQNREHTYTTEFDAAYRQLENNAPRGNIGNALGNRDDPPTSTAISTLLDQIAVEARGTGPELAGYRAGRLFGEDGRQPLDERLVGYLRPRLGAEVTDLLVYLSQLRSRSQASPGAQSYKDIRTAIGRAMRPQVGPNGAVTRPPDEAMLARLYRAVDEDITRLANDRGGEIYTGQKAVVDEQYRDFMQNLRAPLARLFGEGVTPEQAIGRLADAAVGGRGANVDLLRTFYRVVNDKGDRLAATGAILNRMTQDGLPGFLRQYRALSDDARSIMFDGPAREFGRSLDRIARVAGRLEPYFDAAGGQTLRRNLTRATRPGNIALGTLTYINLPTALAGALGTNAMARLMASRRFEQWLRTAPQAVEAGNQIAFQKHMRRLSAIMTAETGISEEVANSIIGDIGG